jgi:hypothetical protein
MTLQTINPQVALQFSNDGGFTWGKEYWKPLGRVGAFGQQLCWDRLGSARDRVFRIIIMDPVKVILTDAMYNSTEGTA